MAGKVNSMKINLELRQLYLNQFVGYKVLAYQKIEGDYEDPGVYLIAIEGPSSIPPYNTLIRLYE
jgi:hypothetical protein